MTSKNHIFYGFAFFESVFKSLVMQKQTKSVEYHRELFCFYRVHVALSQYLLFRMKIRHGTNFRGRKIFAFFSKKSVTDFGNSPDTRKFKFHQVES